MNREWVTRIIQVAAVTLTLAAICQEMEKPKEERTWHGRVAGLIPYDFQMPTIERFKESYWNQYDSRILTTEVFGIGWAINFYALLERMRFIGQGISEEDFLMPTQEMKDLLANPPAAD